MKKLFYLFIFQALVLSSCDMLDGSDDDTLVVENYGMISRMDLRSIYDGDDEYFEAIYCFSYDGSGYVDSFSVLYPAENSGLIEESVTYGFMLTETSLTLSHDYRMLLYDGTDSENAIGEETYEDTYDDITLSDGCVQAAGEYDGPALSFSSLKYEYDDDFHLVSVVDENDDYGNMTFVWEGKNMVKYTKAVRNSLSVNITYTDYPAPSSLGNFLMDFALNLFDGLSSPWVFYTGTPSENLPATISFRTSDVDEPYSADMSFDYVFDGNILTSITCSYSEGYDKVDYVLTFYYDNQDPDDFQWVPIKQF